MDLQKQVNNDSLSTICKVVAMAENKCTVCILNVDIYYYVYGILFCTSNVWFKVQFLLFASTEL